MIFFEGECYRFSKIKLFHAHLFLNLETAVDRLSASGSPDG